MSQPLDRQALDQAFYEARTAHKFTDQPVTDETLHALVDLCKWGPTSLNCQPMRLVFVRSAEAKAKLKESLSPNNADKTMAAPVTAIVAWDTAFYDQLVTQFPANPTMRDMFAGNAKLAQDTAFRNGSLQGAYLMIAARMLGLAAGPMSGFDAAKLNAAFFPDGAWTANFLVNLGYPDPAGYRPRGPRLAFDKMARIA